MTIELTKYQKDAVNAACHAFKNGTSRYLIADEPGLGKTIIARGVIEEMFSSFHEVAPEEPFRVYYFGSNLALLEDTINNKLSKGKTEWVCHTKPDRMSLMADYLLDSNDNIIQRGKVNLFAFSANIIFGGKSSGDNEKERPAYNKLLKEIYSTIKEINSTQKSEEKYISWEKFAVNYNELFKEKINDADLKIRTINLMNDNYKLLSVDVEPIRDIFNRAVLSCSDLKPHLIIMDEFHRYDEVLVDFGKMIEECDGRGAKTKLLLLSATPYNFYPGIRNELKQFGENEKEDDKQSQKLHSFEDVLEFLGGISAINQFNTLESMEKKSEFIKEHYIYRNERIHDGYKKYRTLPTLEDMENYFVDECFEEEKTLYSMDTYTKRYEKLCSGIYSFPVKHHVKDESKQKMFYNGFILPEEGVLPDDYFVFSSPDNKLKRDGFYWKNLRFACIRHYNAEMGRNLLWMPPSWPEYTLQGKFKHTALFSKLLIFSAYKMVPRIISGVFSAYATDDVEVIYENPGLRTFNAAVYNLNADSLIEYASLYDECIKNIEKNIKTENLCDVSDFRKLIQEKITQKNNVPADFRIENWTDYIIASPFMCAIRLYLNNNSEKLATETIIEKAQVIADIFDIYFSKDGIKQAINHIGISTDEMLLQYCVDGNLNGVLKEYQFCCGDNWEEQLKRALLYGTKDGLKGESCEPSCVYVYSADIYNKNEEPFKINCLYADRLGADYTDHAASATGKKNKTHAEMGRDTFNSPFWPMIMCTTSAGQEGYDLDRYCYRIMHYSLPPSTMAFEQRDGRIDRRRSLLARKRMVQWCDLKKINSWESLFEEHKDESGMSPDWTQDGYLEWCETEKKEAIKQERIVPYFQMTGEYVLFRNLMEIKNMYRSKFGLKNESETGTFSGNEAMLKLNDI